MAARNSVDYDHVDLTGDLADDGTRYSDDGGCPPVVFLTVYNDNDTTTTIGKVGKGGQANGDAHRIEYADLAGLAVNDTITVEVTSLHQIDDGLELQAYIDSNSVTATAAINIASPIVGSNVYTITQAFIDELGDVGSGNFAVRLQPRSQEAGDAGIAEVDADLTDSGGDVTLTADPGALTLTGAVANFKTTLAATAGALLLTGAVADFSINTNLDAQPGALTLTGAVAGLDTTLDAQPGALILSGANADFTISLVLDAQPGALILTGATAGLDTTLDAQPGALILTGAVAVFGGATLDAQPGALILTGAVANFGAGLDAQPGALILTGGTADFSIGLTLDAQPGALILTGADADLVATGLVARKGGVRWLLEPDPEIREEKVKELAALVKPGITPKSAARQPQVPEKSLMSIIDDSIQALPVAQQTRVDRLLQETGISMEELLIILSIS